MGKQPQWLSATEARRRYGGRSSATWWRWSKTEGFPKPAIDPGGRPIWRDDELEAYFEGRRAA